MHRAILSVNQTRNRQVDNHADSKPNCPVYQNGPSDRRAILVLGGSEHALEMAKDSVIRICLTRTASVVLLGGT